MTMKTKKTLQHIAAVAVVLLTLCLVFAAPVSAKTVELEVVDWGGDTAETEYKVKGSDDATPYTLKEFLQQNTYVKKPNNPILENGDTLKLPSGKLNVSVGYNIVYGNITIEGADDGSTIFDVHKISDYRIFQVNNRDESNPLSEIHVTFKNFTIEGNNEMSTKWGGTGIAGIVATSALITLDIENVIIKNLTGEAISAWSNTYLTSKTDYPTKENPAGIVINLKNVETNNNKALIHFDTAPWKSHQDDATTKGYGFVHLNYDETSVFNDKTTDNFVYEDDDKNLCPLTYTYKSGSNQMILYQGNMRINDNMDITLGSAVAQIGDFYYGTLAEAVAAAKAGETVTLLKDVSVSEGVGLDQDITFNLGEYTITYTGTDYLFTVTAGKLTINALNEGGVVSNAGIVLVDTNEEDQGCLTVTGGKYSQSENPTYKPLFLFSICTPSETSTITGATISGIGQCAQAAAYSDVIFKDCIIEVTGEPAGTSDKYQHAIIASYGGKVRVEGGSVTSPGVALSSFFTNGEITVKDAVITGGAAALQVMPAAEKSEDYQTGKSSITVSSGTVNGPITTDAVSVGETPLAYNKGEGVASIVITGGTFSVNPSAYIPSGYEVVQPGDKYLVQKYVDRSSSSSSSVKPEEPEQPEEPVVEPETPAAPGEVTVETEVTDGGEVELETPAAEGEGGSAAADEDEAKITGVVLPTGTDSEVTFVPVSEQPAPAGQEENTKKVFEINVPSYEKGKAAVIKFTMTVAELAADGKEAADVALWHFDEETGEWTKLVTTFTIVDGVVYFEAITDDFSPFAIIYEDEPAGDMPGNEPQDKPETPESPAPVLGLLAALGAAVVLRRK